MKGEQPEESAERGEGRECLLACWRERLSMSRWWLVVICMYSSTFELSSLNTVSREKELLGAKSERLKFRRSSFLLLYFVSSHRIYKTASALPPYHDAPSTTSLQLPLSLPHLFVLALLPHRSTRPPPALAPLNPLPSPAPFARLLPPFNL